MATPTYECPETVLGEAKWFKDIQQDLWKRNKSHEAKLEIPFGVE